MDDSVDFCCLCLEYDSNLRNVEWSDEDGYMVQEKLSSFLPECMLMEMEISIYICNACLQVINNTLTFRRQCLDNINILKEYVHKLKALDNSSTYSSLRLPDILYYKQYKSQAEFFTDSPDSKIETPQNSTDITNIEDIVVKVENTSDDQDYLKNEINEEYNIKDKDTQDNFVDCNGVIKTETEETSEDKPENEYNIDFILSERGQKILIINYDKFYKRSVSKHGKILWNCSVKGCRAKCYTEGDDEKLLQYELNHNHNPDVQKLSRQSINNSCKRKAVDDLCVRPTKIISSEVVRSTYKENITTKDINLIRHSINRNRILFQRQQTLSKLTKQMKT